MVYCLFGESCAGKSTLAERLRARTGATVYTGKDYLRLAKNEADAKKAFSQLLAAVPAAQAVIYVVTEPEHLALLPQGCIRVLVTADLGLIKERFARRTGGKLPPPLSAMLERKHGCFDAQPHDFHVHNGNADIDALLTPTTR